MVNAEVALYLDSCVASLPLRNKDLRKRPLPDLDRRLECAVRKEDKDVLSENYTRTNPKGTRGKFYYSVI